MEPRMVFITDGDLVYFRSGKFESMHLNHGHHAAEPAPCQLRGAVCRVWGLGFRV